MTAVRRMIGMVFQKPNPFPTMSIFDNVAAGLRLTGTKRDNLTRAVTRSLRAVGLWDEVKDRLDEPGIGLSGGQQQRLCIARTIAVEPEVILMDEPCSALDPIATLKVEELIDELKDRYTIVIVTHNMQQAARVANSTVFMLDGELIEHGETNEIFTNPRGRTHRALRDRKVRLAAMQETRHQFREELKELEEQTLGGLDLVVSQLDRALESVSYQDVELAAMVVADDDRIDGRYLEVHQGVLSLLARQTPVAGDLRIVAALLHIIRCIERMGDQCVNIAKLVPLSGYEAPKDKDILDAIERMGQLARQQVAQAKEAFKTRNVVARAGSRAPGRRDQPAQPRDLPARGRGRRRARDARVGDVHDPRRALPGADRRQHDRHRRAGRVRRHRPVPRGRRPGPAPDAGYAA